MVEVVVDFLNFDLKQLVDRLDDGGRWVHLIHNCIIGVRLFYNYLIIQSINKHVAMNEGFNDFSTWYYKQPVFTRSYLSVSILLAVLTSLDILGPQYFRYTFNDAFVHLEVWRVATCLFYQGGFSFGYLFKVMYTYYILSHVELDLFKKETYADFLWLCIYLAASMLVIASFLPLYILAEGFLMAMLYIWSKRQPLRTVRIYFMLQVKSGYLPWIMLVFGILSSRGMVYIMVTGLLLGHLYIMLKDILYQKYHKDYLPTPQLFKRLVYRKRSRSQGNVVFGGQGVRM